MSTLQNWYRRIVSYGVRNAVTLMINLRRERIFGLRYDDCHLWLRGKSVDFFVFDSIFRKGEYDFGTGFTPEYIVDAGAFTGLSSIWFHKKYPEAVILAVEPEESNFNMLVRNSGASPNIIPVAGALYGETGSLAISNPSAEKYAFRVGADSGEGRQIAGFSVRELMGKYRLPRIDLLKMDIEGAEYQVFRNDPESWLANVGCLIIELHEYIHPGVTELVVNTLETGGFKISYRGENLIAIRETWNLHGHPGYAQ